jgi:hypothetical protein
MTIRQDDGVIALMMWLSAIILVCIAFLIINILNYKEHLSYIQRNTIETSKPYQSKLLVGEIFYPTYKPIYEEVTIRPKHTWIGPVSLYVGSILLVVYIMYITSKCFYLLLFDLEKS